MIHGRINRKPHRISIVRSEMLGLICSFERVPAVVTDITYLSKHSMLFNGADFAGRPLSIDNPGYGREYGSAHTHNGYLYDAVVAAAVGMGVGAGVEVGTLPSKMACICVLNLSSSAFTSIFGSLATAVQNVPV